MIMKKILSRALTALLAALLVLGALPASAAAADNELPLGEWLAAETDGSDAYYTFNPPSEGAYSVEVISDSGVNVYVSDPSGNDIYTEYVYADSGERWWFYLTEECNIRIGFFGAGAYSLVVNEVPLAESFSVFVGSYDEDVSEYVTCLGIKQMIMVNNPDGNGIVSYIGRLEFSSSDPSVAEAGYSEWNATPVIIPKTVGETDITARTVFGLEYTFHLTVTEAEPIAFAEQKVLPLPEDETYYDFFYTFVPEEDGEYLFIGYETPEGTVSMDGELYDSDGNYISQFFISNNGCTELTAGETYYIRFRCYTHFTWETGERTLTFYVDKPVPPEGIRITGNSGEELTEAEVYAGDTYSVNEELYPLNTKEEEVIWSSDAPEVAEITETYMNGAAITARSEGRAVITARTESGSAESSFILNVKIRPRLNEGENIIEYTPEMNEGGGPEMEFVPEKSGYYRISASDFTTDDIVSVNYWIYDESGYQVAYGYSSAGNENAVSCELKAGEKYRVSFSFYNVASAGSFIFKLEESLGIVSLELVSAPDRTVYIKGETSRPDMTGLSVKAVLSDGSEAYWTYSGNGGNDEIAGYELTVGTYNGEDDNLIGIYIGCAGLEVRVPLTILDSPVESLEYIGDPLELLENNGGYDNGDYYYYYYYSLGGKLLKINYTDGSVKLVELNEDYYNMKIDGYGLEFTDNQWYVGGWKTDTENYIIVKYLGAQAKIPVHIVSDNTEITKLELIGGEISVIENVGGYEEDGIYYYWPYADDLRFRVTYSDGTVKEAGIYDQLDGMYFTYDFDKDQREKPWCLGEENFATVSYCGVSCRIPVTVEPNTVKGIKLIAPEDPGYIFGDTSFGSSSVDDSGNVEFHLWPRMEEGYKLAVTYADNSEKTYTAADIDENGNIDGRSFWIAAESITTPGTAVVLAEYMGYTANAAVQVAPSPVKSVEVLKSPQKLKYEFMSSAYVGMELKINYTDGRSEEVPVTEKMAEVYEFDTYDFPEIRAVINGYSVETSVSYKDGYADKSYIIYLGAAAEIGDYAPDYGYNDIVKTEFVGMKKGLFGSVVRYTFTDGTHLDVTLNDDFQSADGRMYFSETPYGYISFYINSDNSVGVSGGLGNLYLDFKPGDLNGDCTVDIRDLIRLKKYFAGAAELESGADFTCNGNTDAVDLTEMYKSLMGVVPLATKAGDIDCNGSLSRVDLELLRLWLEGQKISLPAAADINCDGVINTEDLELLEGMIK